MSLLHDWAESKIGDFMPDEIEPDKKIALEENAMNEILGILPNPVKDDYSTIWNEYQDMVSSESKLVHEIDKLEMVLQAKIYEKDADPEKIKLFVTSAVEQILDNDLKKILSEIIQ